MLPLLHQNQAVASEGTQTKGQFPEFHLGLFLQPVVYAKWTPPFAR